MNSNFLNKNGSQTGYPAVYEETVKWLTLRNNFSFEENILQIINIITSYIQLPQNVSTVYLCYTKLLLFVCLSVFF